MTNSSEILENFEADKWHICGQTVCLFCKNSFKKFSQNAASVWNTKFPHEKKARGQICLNTEREVVKTDVSFE